MVEIMNRIQGSRRWLIALLMIGAMQRSIALNREEFAVEVYNKLSTNPMGSRILRLLEKIFPKIRRVSELKAAYKVDLTKNVGQSYKEFLEKNSGKSWDQLKNEYNITDNDLIDASANMLDTFFNDAGLKDLVVNGRLWTPRDLLENTPGNLTADILGGAPEQQIRKGLQNLEINSELYIKGGKKAVFDHYFEGYKQEMAQKGKIVSPEDVNMPDFIDYMVQEGGMSLTGLSKMSESELSTLRDMNFSQFNSNKNMIDQAGEGLTVGFKEPIPE
jgi:hypothetical protein